LGILEQGMVLRFGGRDGDLLGSRAGYKPIPGSTDAINTLCGLGASYLYYSASVGDSSAVPARDFPLLL